MNTPRFVVRHCPGWGLHESKQYAIWDIQKGAFLAGTYSNQEKVLDWVKKFESGEWSWQNQGWQDEKGNKVT